MPEPGTAEIPNWPSLVAYLERVGTSLSHPGGGQDADGGEGRRRLVQFHYDHAGRRSVFRAHVMPHNGRPWLAIAVALCRSQRLRVRPALLFNKSLPFGTLAIAGDTAIIQQTVPVAGLRYGHVDVVLRGLADVSEQLFAAINPESHEAQSSQYAALFREVPSVLETWRDYVTYATGVFRNVKEFPGQGLRFDMMHGDTEIPVGSWCERTPSGSLWLGLGVKIGPSEHLRFDEALQANQTLPIGAIGTVRDEALVGQSLPLGGLLTVQLERTLHALGALRNQLHADAALPSGAESKYGYLFEKPTV